MVCLSVLIFSAAFKQCVGIDSFSLSRLSTFFPKDLDTQQLFLFVYSVSKSIQGIPLNSITVLAPNTFVLFFTQVFDIFFNLYALSIPFLMYSFDSCRPTPHTSEILNFFNISSISFFKNITPALFF